MFLLLQDSGAHQRFKQLLNFFRTPKMEGPIYINGGTRPPLHHLFDFVHQRSH